MCYKQRIIFFKLLIILNFNLKLFADTPELTIITSIYKGDEFIEEFLNDIVKQTFFKRSELILINANSPGHEERIIREFMKKYPNIIYKKLIRDPGIYAVWNYGVKLASGEFITNANLDDRLAHTAHEDLVKFLKTNSNIDLVYSDYYTTLSPNQIFETGHYISNSDLPEFSINNMTLCLPGPNPVWRKSIHNKFGFFDPRYKACGDWEFWLRCASRGSNFKKLNKVTCLYYYNPEGLSTDVKGRAWRDNEVDGIYKRYRYLWNNQNKINQKK